MRAWIIGSGGLLGHAILNAATTRRHQTKIKLHQSPRIPWTDEHEAIRVLEEQVARFAVALTLEPWIIIWAAGSSIVASTEQDTQSELRVFKALCRAIRDKLAHHQGIFFVASSAGGVYAGSAGPPFDISTVPVPISPYGQLKLAQEAAAIEICSPTCAVVIGRFSNLYGPARDKEKQQGLVQKLCEATLTRTALNIYVSMDTLRDYLFTEDAAHLVWDAIDHRTARKKSGAEVIILASGVGTSIAEIIATIQSVTHRRVPLALGSHPSSDRQVIDLRLSPDLTCIQLAGLTPLPNGVRRLYDSILGGVH
jgi:UDP-glucose 4-epimerase